MGMKFSVLNEKILGYQPVNSPDSFIFSRGVDFDILSTESPYLNT